MKKCAGCPATVTKQKWAMIRASSEGWLFLKDGTAYCPDHLPEWVAEWRARKWRPGINRVIEEALIEAEPAAEWLRRHPPGARLPEHLEPGYEPEEYEPESDGVDG